VKPGRHGDHGQIVQIFPPTLILRRGVGRIRFARSSAYFGAARLDRNQGRFGCHEPCIELSFTRTWIHLQLETRLAGSDSRNAPAAHALSGTIARAGERRLFICSPVVQSTIQTVISRILSPCHCYRRIEAIITDDRRPLHPTLVFGFMPHAGNHRQCPRSPFDPASTNEYG